MIGSHSRRTFDGRAVPPNKQLQRTVTRRRASQASVRPVNCGVRHSVRENKMRKTNQSAGPITVLESGDPALLAVAKSLLEGAGIQYFAKGEGVQDLFAGGRIGAGFNPFTGPIQLQVAADDAEQAKALLGDLDARTDA